MKTEPEYVSRIVELYKSGKEQKEITEITGQTYCVIRYWLKKKGLYDPNRRQTWAVHSMQGVQKCNTQSKQEAETRLALFLLEKGFSYLGGYDGRYSTVQIACPQCGGTFSRYYDPKFLFKQKQIRCPICNEQALSRKEQEREWKIRKRMDEVHTCKECGCLYTYRSYAQSIGVDPLFIQRIDVCSEKCKRKRRTKTHDSDHKKRAVKYKTEYDPTINLDDLISRDGLRCALCGGMCDRSDYKKNKKGFYVFGVNYPSIDHIMPISKGGGHTWDNVQVAHRGCNTRKGNKVVA